MAISAAKLSCRAISAKDSRRHQDFVLKMSDQCMVMKWRPVIVEKLGQDGNPTRIWLMASLGKKNGVDVHGIDPNDIAVLHPTRSYDEEQAVILYKAVLGEHSSVYPFAPIDVGINEVTVWQMSGEMFQLTPGSLRDLQEKSQERLTYWTDAPADKLGSSHSGCNARSWNLR